jgi:hypothetical protein
VANPADDDFEHWKRLPAIAGYPIKHKWQLEASQPLLDIITARTSYFEAGNGWTCLFEPHHVLELRSGAKRATIVICLTCGDVEFRMGGVAVITKSVRPGGARGAEGRDRGLAC